MSTSSVLSSAGAAALAVWATSCIKDLPVDHGAGGSRGGAGGSRDGAGGSGAPTDAGRDALGAATQICDPPCGVGLTCNTTSRQCISVSREQGCGNTAGLQAGAAYPMYRNCPTRSGASPFTGPTGSRLGPIANAGASKPFPAFPGAVAADGTLYTRSGLIPNTTGDGVVAFRGTEIVWSIADLSMAGTPAIGADGTLYFGSFDGRLHALGPEGKERWTFDPGKALIQGAGSSPVIGPDGTVYFTADTAVHAVARTGAERWSFAPGGSLTDAAMSLDGSMVYVASTSGRVHALRSDGSVLWSSSFAGDTSALNGPAVGMDGAVYVSAQGVFAFDAQGRPSWIFPSSTTPGMGGNCTSVTLSEGGSIYVVCDRRLSALDRNGAPQWSVQLAGESYSFYPPSTVAADGEIFQSATNQLLRLGPDGAIRSLWTVSIDDSPSSVSSTGAIGVDHTLYLETEYGAWSHLWTVGP